MPPEVYECKGAGRSQRSERQLLRATLWLRTTDYQTGRIFRADFRSALHFGVHIIPAIPCRANSTDVTKDLRKVLLGLEATGHGYVQYSRMKRPFRTVPTDAIQPLLEPYNALAATMRDTVAQIFKVPKLTVLQQATSVSVPGKPDTMRPSSPGKQLPEAVVNIASAK